MLQKYFRSASQDLTQHPVFPIINIGSLVAGIATAILIFLASHTSGNAAFMPVSPSITLLQVQEPSEVQDLGQALLIILMFERAGETKEMAC